MITEDKVTEIFSIADDFCKVFDAQMAKYTSVHAPSVSRSGFLQPMGQREQKPN